MNDKRTVTREQLESIAHRKIGSYLHNKPDAAVEAALWDEVYAGYSPVSHEVATAVAAELEASTRTIQELLNGWKPAALKQE